MKILKRALLLAVAVILAVSINIGSFSVLSARAADRDVLPGKFFAGNMITRVKENDDIVVHKPLDSTNIDVKITNPSGLDMTGDFVDEDAGAYFYKAAQLGHYKVTYFEKVTKRAEYSYNVFCYESKNYYIRVNEKMEKTGEKETPVFMPTYMGKGEDLVLPTFDLVYKNSKGEEVVENLGDTSIFDNEGTMGVSYSKDIANRTDGTNILVTTEAGSLSVIFWARISGGSKKYTKEYTINVQADFKDEKAPVLNTLSITGTANLNVLYTLPVATATDPYEKNIFMDVKVIGPDGETVKEYKADDYGYAGEMVTPVKPVAFDNKTVISFYPVKEGKYTVFYTAYDRYNKSATHDYDINCSDKIGPVIQDLATDIIPTKWGLESVTKIAATDTGEDEANPKLAALTDKSFKLPLPKVVDNADAEKDLTLTLTLKNPESNLVAYWKGTMSEFRNDGVSLSSGFNTYFRDGHKDKLLKADADDLMEFSFEYLNMKMTYLTPANDGHNLLNEDSEIYGNWTWIYEVTDTKNNGGSGTARIIVVTNLVRNFKSSIRPKINENNLDIPKHVLINNENDVFEIPLIPMYAHDDTRLTTEYKMSSDVDLSTLTAPVEFDGVDKYTVKFDGVTYTVKNEHDIKKNTNDARGGQKYNVEKIGDNYYMLISEDNKDFAFALPRTEVTFEFKAVDDVGNESKPNTFGIKMFYSDWDITQELFIKGNDSEIDDGAALNLTQTFKQKQPVTVGGFVVPEIDQEYIDYTGVEIDITDADGAPLSFSTYIYNRGFVKVDKVGEPGYDLVACTTNEILDDEIHKVYNIYVEGITFTPAKSGLHRINIRIYDISGQSAVYGYSFNVEKTLDGSTNTSKPAAKIEGTGEIRTEYELDKSYRVQNGDKENVIVRYVEGFGFGLMNYNFIGHYAGRNGIKNYLIEEFDGWAINKLKIQSTCSIELKNEEKPVITVHDIIPKYLSAINDADQPKDTDDYSSGKYIEIEGVTAFTKFVNCEVDFLVTFNSDEVNGGGKLYQELDEHGVPTGELTFKSKGNVTENIGGQDEIREVDYTYVGIFAFPALSEGEYTVTITAKAAAGPSTAEYKIWIGDRTPPAFTVNPSLTAVVGDEFIRTAPEIKDSYNKVVIKLTGPDDNTISEAEVSYASVEDLKNNLDSGWYFVDAGPYTLTYEISNSKGIKSTQIFTIEVSKKGSNPTAPPAALTTVLIIIGVLLIIGVIVYVVRFRAVKK